MAEKFFLGQASSVAQITTTTVGGTLSGETFTISVGGVLIATHTDSTGTISDTVAALVASWNLSTHPWATGVTATDVSPLVTLTASTPGVPFDVDLNTPGGSATFAEATPTANTGPSVLNLADNWDGDALPTPGDNLHFMSPISICWGLEGLTDTYGDITFYQQAIGARFGLNQQAFTTSSNGSTVNQSYAEYRDIYLKLKSNGTVTIGKETITAAGPSRLCLDLDTIACTVDIRKVGTAGDAGRPSVRLLTNQNGTDVYIRSAANGVGIATEPGQVSACGDIIVTGESTTRVFVGVGVTYDKFEQDNGINVINSAGTLAEVNVNGGTLTTEGEYTITALTGTGGTTYANNTKTAGDAITTLTLSSDAIIDTRKSALPRTFGTTSVDDTASVLRDPNVVTLTTVTPQKNIISGA